MASLEVSVRIERVKDALSDKGFEDLYATHYDNAPSRMIVLHDDHGRVAHGDEEELTRFIEASDDVTGLWAALEEAGLIRTAAATRA